MLTVVYCVKYLTDFIVVPCTDGQKHQHVPDGEEGRPQAPEQAVCGQVRGDSVLPASGHASCPTQGKPVLAGIQRSVFICCLLDVISILSALINIILEAT